MSATVRSTTSSTAKISSPGTARKGIAPMCARSSSVSARSFAMLVRGLTISKITPVLDTAGSRKTETRPCNRWAFSLSAKTAFLAVVFILVPVFLYLEFRRAYEESQELLLRSVRAEGHTISQSLLPFLETADSALLPELARDLARYAGEVTTVTLLLQPACS